jgi:uracil-DNA glycosylase
MSMTREDVLRELELLPVWRLRAPIVSDAMVTAPVSPTLPAPTFAETNVAETSAVELNPAVEPTPIVPTIPTPTPTPTPTPAPAVLALFCTVSEDKKWAFIWPVDRAPIGLQSTLFDNILLALHIQKTQSYPLEDIRDIEARVLVVMGEDAAQAYLGTQESLSQLRGRVHQQANKPSIVTYHPSDLLKNVHLKAKTWDDLCLAMRQLNA